MRYRGLRAELEHDLQDIVSKVNTFKEKISANIAGDSSESGLLLHNEIEYMKCLSINEERMLELLAKSESIWERKIEEARASEDLTTKMDSMLEAFKSKF